jgi:hypothetical protein
LKTYSFHQGEIPKGFKIDFEPSLFNLIRHRLTQGESWISFHLIQKEKKKVFASSYFHKDQHSAVSPLRAPFGSIEFSDLLPIQDLFDFYNQIENKLREEGIEKIIIKNPPDGYTGQKAAVRNTLLFNKGFRVIDAELSALIQIDRSGFEDKIETWEKRKLNQAKKAGLRFHELPLTSLSDIYEFVKNCRAEKNQQLSMPLDDLAGMCAACKHDVFIFCVLQGKELAAASISIRVNKHVLYNFYSAHPKKFDSLSPVVLLMRGMYAWSYKHDFKQIDLGTSAQGGKPNFGLLDFKMRIGGVLSTKLTFEKDLA